MSLNFPLSSATHLELLDRWSEPQRHYHGTRHWRMMHADVAEMADLYDFSQEERDEACLTVAYHDAVYKIGQPKGWNEKQSAALALSCDEIERAMAYRVADNILLTIEHKHPKTLLQACVLDADLANLGRDYEENGALIRAEYPMATEEQWLQGRLAFLSGMLNRPVLYYTSWGRKYEAPARASMEADIATCQAAIGLL